MRHPQGPIWSPCPLAGLALVAACGKGPGATSAREAPAEAAPIPAADESTAPSSAAPPTVAPTPNADVDVVRTSLTVNVSTREATAHVELGAGSAGASLEIGDLEIEAVRIGDAELPHTQEGELLHLAVPARDAPVTVEIQYRYRRQEKAEGAYEHLTLTWPYFCGRVFPCNSDPADGQRFDLSLTGLPREHVAIHPRRVDADGPAYMLAWTHGPYETLELGETSSGTKVRAHAPAAALDEAREGTALLVRAFDYLELTYGDYLYGDEVATVWVEWSEGAYGGMEHHPYWHVAADAFADPVVHVHEAAHGWFGNGVRIACWEDFVLSESLASYLAARALEAAGGTRVGEEVWADYGERLDRLGDGPLAAKGWPEGCGTHDVLEDQVFSTAPYMRGAFFFRALEARVGRAPLDAALRRFYLEHRGQAARFSELLAAIAEDTGFDPLPCAESWLRNEQRPSSPSICEAPPTAR